MNRCLVLAAPVCLILGICADSLGQSADLREAAESINQTMRINHYRPAAQALEVALRR